MRSPPGVPDALLLLLLALTILWNMDSYLRHATQPTDEIVIFFEFQGNSP